MLKRSLCIFQIVCLLALSLCIPVTAANEPEQYGNFYCVFDDQTMTATITGLVKNYLNQRVIEIPGSIGDYTVTTIGPGAFVGCTADKITVGEGVETLKTRAFAKMSVTEVELPSTLKTMEKEIFYNCYNLTSVVFKNTNVNIPDGCFQNCKSLVSTRDIVTPEPIVSLGSSAFESCTSLREADIEGVQTVGYWVFRGCSSIESAVIPESLNDADTLGLFSECKSLKTLTVNAKALRGSSIYDCPALETVITGDTNEMLDSCFKKCPALKTVVLGQGIKTLKSAFCGCTALSDISFPDTDFIVIDNIVADTAYEQDPFNYDENGIMYIGKNLVKGTDAVGDVVVREGTINVSEAAFEKNDNTTSVVFPASVKTIRDRSFRYCKSLKSVKAVGVLESVGYAFCECPQLSVVDIPTGLTKFPGGALSFRGTAYIKDEKNFDDTALYVGGMLVGYYTSHMPRRYSVRRGTAVIADYAFNWVYGHDTPSDIEVSFNLPEGVEYVGKYAFNNSGDVMSIVIPKSVKFIGEGCFSSSSGSSDDYDDSDRDVKEGPGYNYDYSSARDIYYLGTEEDWNKIELYAEIPEGTALHFATDFKDVADGKWYSSGARYCSSRGLMTGISGDTFGPNVNMTRAMFVTLLARLAKADLSGYKAGAFSDVKEGKWYAKAVAWAVENGYTSGTGGGKFSPDRAVTREELAQFLYTYAKKNGADVSASADLSGYADRQAVSSWAVKAVKWAVAEGFISGISKTELSPASAATRAQTAVLLMQFTQKVID